MTRRRPDEAGAGRDPGQLGLRVQELLVGGPDLDPRPALGVQRRDHGCQRGLVGVDAQQVPAAGLSAYSCRRASTTARSSGCPVGQGPVQFGRRTRSPRRRRPAAPTPAPRGPRPGPGSRSSTGTSRGPGRSRSGSRRRRPAAATARPSPRRSGPRSPAPAHRARSPPGTSAAPRSIVAWPLRCRTSKYPSPYDAAVKREPLQGAALLDDQLGAGVGGGRQDRGLLRLITKHRLHALRRGRHEQHPQRPVVRRDHRAEGRDRARGPHREQRRAFADRQIRAVTNDQFPRQVPQPLLGRDPHRGAPRVGQRLAQPSFIAVEEIEESSPRSRSSAEPKTRCAIESSA